ncbi:hypothetical protein Ae505Ps2_6173 [Pseudonocardia sp. Ae505_Ps2]|nr:hypothetical protein Ae505Ps2_6173 [Pseudonocardia sp. Ae505_Ps2]
MSRTMMTIPMADMQLSPQLASRSGGSSVMDLRWSRRSTSDT